MPFRTTPDNSVFPCNSSLCCSVYNVVSKESPRQTKQLDVYCQARTLIHPLQRVLQGLNGTVDGFLGHIRRLTVALDLQYSHLKRRGGVGNRRLETGQEVHYKTSRFHGARLVIDYMIKLHFHFNSFNCPSYECENNKTPETSHHSPLRHTFQRNKCPLQW